MTSFFKLQVYGRTWEQRYGFYEYPLDAETAATLKSCREPAATVKATQLAGDFCSLSDWRLLETSSYEDRERRPGRLREFITTTRHHEFTHRAFKTQTARNYFGAR